MKNKPAPHAPAKPSSNRRDLGTWIVRNLVLLVVALVLVSFLKGKHMGQWLWNYYIASNLEFIRSYPDLSLDERLSAKLGADYRFMLYLRDNTPEDAVVYYPTGDDFRAARSADGKQIFSGQLTDKLTAVRFLYPRRVVVEKELGQTAYTDSLTHITVVSERNLKMLPYEIDPARALGVYPVKVAADPMDN